MKKVGWFEDKADLKLLKDLPGPPKEVINLFDELRRKYNNYYEYFGKPPTHLILSKPSFEELYEFGRSKALMAMDDWYYKGWETFIGSFKIVMTNVDSNFMEFGKEQF